MSDTNPTRPSRASQIYQSTISKVKWRANRKQKPEEDSTPKPTPAPQSTSAQTSQILYLRINQDFLRLLVAPTETHPDPPSIAPAISGNLNVIIATLEALAPFAGNTVDWLIRVARLIFEPLGSSSLFTFQTGTVQDWADRAMDSSWRMVADGEQLRATIYEFRPDTGTVEPTRISLRQTRSVTTNDTQNLANAFRNAIVRRYPTCVVTKVRSTLIASHLIPRRLGDVGVRSVFRRFTNSSDQEVHAVNRYHPSLGILLFVGLDALVDTYCMGFWNIGNNQYVVHNFSDLRLSFWGGDSPLDTTSPLLHGLVVTLTTNDAQVPNPPTGVFDWHYLQCVLTLLASPEYRALANIHCFVFPFRTADDDDNDDDLDFDDPRNIENPPYPSYGWDLALSRQYERLEEEERRRHITAWSRGISQESVTVQSGTRVSPPI